MGGSIAIDFALAFALVIRFRHRNAEDPVDVFDAHGPPVNRVGQEELT
jgi:hypothetical protein